MYEILRKISSQQVNRMYISIVGHFCSSPAKMYRGKDSNKDAGEILKRSDFLMKLSLL